MTYSRYPRLKTFDKVRDYAERNLQDNNMLFSELSIVYHETLLCLCDSIERFEGQPDYSVESLVDEELVKKCKEIDSLVCKETFVQYVGKDSVYQIPVQKIIDWINGVEKENKRLSEDHN